MVEMSDDSVRTDDDLEGMSDDPDTDDPDTDGEEELQEKDCDARRKKIITLLSSLEFLFESSGSQEEATLLLSLCVSSGQHGKKHVCHRRR